MPKLTIDGREVTIPEGASVLDAARALGIEIPALCYLETCAPSTSCMACVVKLGRSSGRLVPSCATRAEEGMEVESESEEVRGARRTALELILSDHLGDCQAPCQRICPLGIDIPLVLRLVTSGDLDAAFQELREESPLPGVLGRICPANCENGCRRGVADGAVSVRGIERHLSDSALRGGDVRLPTCRPPSGRRVAVVGAGPAGLSAAYFLSRAGHECIVLEKEETAGGSLRPLASTGELPAEVVDSEIERLERIGCRFDLSRPLQGAEALERLLEEHDAVLLATGELAGGGSWGLETTPSGLRVDPATWTTSRPGVFAAGDAIKAAGRPVKAMADGKSAAAGVDQYLAGGPVSGPERVFTCRAGKVSQGEVETFLRLSSRESRRAPAVSEEAESGLAELTVLQAEGESERCLHCDCRSAGDCKLRLWADRYGADAHRFKGERRQFTQQIDHPHVIYEPGKCILCGICVQIAAEDRDALGLTFIGRGFEVRIGVPFDESISKALRNTARRVAESCPTGAISLREDARRPEPSPSDDA